MNKKIEDLIPSNWTKKYKTTDTKGSLGQTEISYYEIFDENGNLMGEIKYTEHTQLRSLQTRTSAEWSQKNF